MDQDTTTQAAKRRRTQHERRAEAERRVLDSALDLVVEKGVVRMTLGEVGERAGYSRGLPAHHYGNKEGLLKALIVHIVDDFRDARLEANMQPGLDSVLGTMRMYLDRSGNRDRGLLAMHVLFSDVFVSGGELATELEAFTDSTLAHFRKEIRTGIRRGEIREDVDAAAQAAVILGMLRGVSAQFYLGAPSKNWKRTRDVALHAVEQELRSCDHGRHADPKA
jgi:AcrR family transcriptional regulator